MLKTSKEAYLESLELILEKTDQLENKLDPYYIMIRNSLGSEEPMSVMEYRKTYEAFARGVVYAEKNLCLLEKLRAPRSVSATHKILVKAYRQYVEGAELMHESIYYKEYYIDEAEFLKSDEMQIKALKILKTNIAEIKAKLSL